MARLYAVLDRLFMTGRAKKKAPQNAALRKLGLSQCEKEAEAFYNVSLWEA